VGTEVYPVDEALPIAFEPVEEAVDPELIRIISRC
jgi:hypothetical protein